MSYRIEDKLTFIHVPKTGGTSITRLIQSKYQHEFSGRTHDTWNDLPDHWRDNVFAVVRNPYSRVVSLWTFAKKVLMKKLDKDPEFIQPQLDVLDLGFKHFVFECQETLWRKTREHQSDGLFWTQKTQLNKLPGDLAGITLLRMENLQEQFSALMTRNGLRHHVLTKWNVSGDPGDYRRHYDPETKREVEKFFGDEIEKLGYEF